MSSKIGIGVNLKTLEILSKYLPKDKALEATKELTQVEYEIRQDLKEVIINEFRAVSEPQFTFPGYEKLPANTIALIDEKYDYQRIVDAQLEQIELIGVPEEYKEG